MWAKDRTFISRYKGTNLEPEIKSILLIVVTGSWEKMFQWLALQTGVMALPVGGTLFSTMLFKLWTCDKTWLIIAGLAPDIIDWEVPSPEMVHFLYLVTRRCYKQYLWKAQPWLFSSSLKNKFQVFY